MLYWRLNMILLAFVVQSEIVILLCLLFVLSSLGFALASRNTSLNLGLENAGSESSLMLMTSAR